MNEAASPVSSARFIEAEFSGGCCAACIHWKDPTLAGDDTEALFGVCIQFKYDLSTRRLTYANILAHSPAAVAAEIETPAWFGCIDWEARKPE